MHDKLILNEVFEGNSKLILNETKLTKERIKDRDVRRFITKVNFRKQMKDKISEKSLIPKLAINVVTWSDVDARTPHCWGDYWVKKRFEYHLRKLGFTPNVVPKLADVTIYLWGSPMRHKHSFPYLYNPNSYNIAWVYGHPQRMDAFEASKYDLIFALSEEGVKQFSIISDNVYLEPMIGCTDFRIPKKSIPNDVVFVGNARGKLPYGRKIIQWLDKKVNLSLYGLKWQRKTGFNKEWIKGDYIDYNKLPQLYKGAKISLNDHHDDMAPWGYVSVRVFDILASGGFCISDYNPGIEKIFGNAVPMYKNENELNRLIHKFLKDDETRERLSKKGRKIAMEHRYIDRVKTMLDVASIEYKEK